MPAASRLRRVASIATAALGCLLCLVSVVAVWARDQVLDTDRYLQSVEPLASEPVIQDEISAKVTAALQRQLDAEAVVRRYLRPQSSAMATSFAQALDDLVATQTSRFVRSAAFQRLWVTLNREVHEELVRVLTGDDSDTVSIDDGRLTLDLSGVAEAVRRELLEQGLRVVARMPPITLVVDIADARGLESARKAVRTLDRTATWLPVAALVLLGSAVLLARRRRRAGVLVLCGVLTAMLVTLLLVRLGASVVADQVSASAASPDAVHAYYDGATRLLRRGAVVVAAVAALLAAGILLSARMRSVPDRVVQ